MMGQERVVAEPVGIAVRHQVVDRAGGSRPAAGLGRLLGNSFVQRCGGLPEPCPRHEPDLPVQRQAEGAAAGVPAAVGEVLRGPGAPLPGEVRLAMERAFAGAGAAPASVLPVTAPGQGKPAMSTPGDTGEREADAVATRVLASPADRVPAGPGPDFSAVRVHTGPAAAAAAQAIQAAAYTVGHDVVFGAGRYQPHSAAGRSLLAHELTHVLQQRTGAPRLSRKEVNASLASANRGSVGPSDWLDLDRQEWEMLSLRGEERALSPDNTFMRAAYYNTKNVLPAEYRTIRERHDYYDLIAYVFENDRKTLAALRDVRFFAAAALVTGTPGIGSVDTAVGAKMLGQDTRQILRDINEELLALNMKVIHNLMFEWQEPRDPATGAKGTGSGFDFDIAMVENEQRTVGNFITKNQSRFTSGVTDDLNKLLDPDKFGQFWNPSRPGFEWAQKALGVPALDFRELNHRKAIGFAEVFIFHRKSRADYEAFVRLRLKAGR